MTSLLLVFSGLCLVGYVWYVSTTHTTAVQLRDRKLRALTETLGSVVSGGVLAATQASVIRSKDIEFVPTPAVAAKILNSHVDKMNSLLIACIRRNAHSTDMNPNDYIMTYNANVVCGYLVVKLQDIEYTIDPLLVTQYCKSVIELSNNMTRAVIRD